MEKTIIKEKRKTLVLRLVDENRIEIKSPLNMSDKKINDFIASKKDWIDKKVARLKECNAFASQFDFDNFIYLDGKKLMPTKDLMLTFDALTRPKKLLVIREKYVSMFDHLKDKVTFLATKFSFTVNNVKIGDSTYKWGTFSIKDEMCLNYKLVILPPHLQEYVIIHELCHSRHMDHSPAFWKEVEKYCPNYKECKKEMNMFSFVLKSAF